MRVPGAAPPPGEAGSGEGPLCVQGRGAAGVPRAPPHHPSVEAALPLLQPSAAGSAGLCGWEMAALCPLWRCFGVRRSCVLSQPRPGSPGAERRGCTKLLGSEGLLPAWFLFPSPPISIHLPREVEAAADIGAGAVSYVNGCVQVQSPDPRRGASSSAKSQRAPPPSPPPPRPRWLPAWCCQLPALCWGQRMLSCRVLGT